LILAFGFTVILALSSPAHEPVTRAVETVEKVPFQKLIFEKWDRNIEKRLVLYVSNNILTIFEPFLSLLWEFFVKIFQTKGFSTVSLGSQVTRMYPNEKIYRMDP
jgi:hypothetical protein